MFAISWSVWGPVSPSIGPTTNTAFSGGRSRGALDTATGCETDDPVAASGSHACPSNDLGAGSAACAWPAALPTHAATSSQMRRETALRPLYIKLMTHILPPFRSGCKIPSPPTTGDRRRLTTPAISTEKLSLRTRLQQRLAVQIARQGHLHQLQNGRHDVEHGEPGRLDGLPSDIEHGVVIGVHAH